MRLEVLARLVQPRSSDPNLAPLTLGISASPTAYLAHVYRHAITPFDRAGEIFVIVLWHMPKYTMHGCTYAHMPNAGSALVGLGGP